MKLVLALCLALGAHAASATSTSDVVRTYAQSAQTRYQAALAKAINMQTAIATFTSEPSETHLNFAREAWLAARAAYSPSEVYRFYAGPIDDARGLEGQLNAWPLDEVYIDYVQDDATAGIIQNQTDFPYLTADVLTNLNEKDGDANIATGYHAVEFLLWGQDLSETGAGDRKFTDYTTAPFAERRAQYLNVVTQKIVDDLTILVADWDLSNPSSYGAQFMLPANEMQSLTNILKGIYDLSASELAHERIFAALDNASQEDEHSCFSDNTHNDIIDNFIGIQEALNGGLVDLINEADPIVAEEIGDALEAANIAVRAIPVPFDQAIIHHKAEVLDSVKALEVLGEAVKQGALAIGVDIPN